MGSKIGVLKIAAGRLGLSFEEYLARIASGLKWCCDCSKWKSVDEFCIDRSRGSGRSAMCRTCKSTPKKRSCVRRGVPINGNKKQAGTRIKLLVSAKAIPNPNSLRCAICNHLGNDRGHEYHHHKGYDAEFHEDVIPLCRSCHAKVHNRGKHIRRKRTPTGRFV